MKKRAVELIAEINLLTNPSPVPCSASATTSQSNATTSQSNALTSQSNAKKSQSNSKFKLTMEDFEQGYFPWLLVEGKCLREAYLCGN